MTPIKHCVLLTILILSSFFDATIAETNSPCGDWVQYKDEKCFKILDDTFRSFADAAAACSKLEHKPTLPVIHNLSEQIFLVNYLFKTSKKVDNFWLGAKFGNSKFTWLDNSTLTFANWERTPKNKVNHCVQIDADVSKLGKWIDEPCEKKNLVVCQRVPSWTLARLQRTLVETRKELHESMEQAQRVISGLKKSLSEAIAVAQTNVQTELNTFKANAKKEGESLKKNLSTSIESVKNETTSIKKGLIDSIASAVSEMKSRLIPIGFIYVQLPSEKKPSRIWSDMTWYDVSSTYSGVFFRVTGGNAGSFGEVQESNSPHLGGILYDNADCNLHGNWSEKVSTVLGKWSSPVVSGRFARGGINNCNNTICLISMITAGLSLKIAQTLYDIIREILPNFEGNRTMRFGVYGIRCINV